MSKQLLAQRDGHRNEWAVFARDEREGAKPHELIFVAGGLTEGDAKLFAAAPTMLAACKLALEYRKITHHGDDKVIATLSSAISKAQGEPS